MGHSESALSKLSLLRLPARFSRLGDLARECALKARDFEHQPELTGRQWRPAEHGHAMPGPQWQLLLLLV